MLRQLLSLLPALNFSLKGSLSIHTLLPAVMFITMLPHLYTITPVFSFFILFILLIFTFHTLGILSLPGKLFRFFLVIISLALLVLNFGFTFSQKASLTLLCLMVSLKLLEIQNELDRRNIFIVLFLAYFILVTHFLYSQNVLLMLFSLMTVLAVTLLLAAFNRKPQTLFTLNENLQLIFNLFFKAVPIAIVLFLFFPRIPGPLWSLPDDGQMGTTGLSDKMYPGSVTELVDSEEIAFRIDFRDAPPPANKLYWRGPVLTETDGFLWSQKPSKPLIKDLKTIVQNRNMPVSYTITLEPHQKKWLFTLEMPTKIHGDTIEDYYLSSDLQLLNKNNINQLTQYQVTSMTHFTLNKVTQNELLEALSLSGSYNPRTRALGQQWRNSINSDRKIVLTALNYFKNNPFYYTKKPAAMIDNPSDEFLFEKKRGFCEHYASSFVLLMRAANIPARVVTGYQGIEKNDVGNYYIVRQSNAHAWAEVWVDNDGWVRVDPTSMIPPERIEADILETYLERLSFSSLNLPDLPQLSAQQKTLFYNFWKQLNQSIDNIKHKWNNWILGYDQTKQYLLLTLMGLNSNWETLLFLLIAGLIGVIILFQALNYYKNYQQTDKVYRNYLKFIDKLNQAGMTLQLHEGPDAIKNQAIHHFPEQEHSIRSIIENYILIRYASQSNKLLIKQFISQIKQFKT